MRHSSRKVTFIIALAVFSLFFHLISAIPSFATELDDLRNKLETAQDQYNSTQDELEKLSIRIEEQTMQVQQAETDLSHVKSELLEQIRWEYKNNSPTNILDVIIHSSSITGCLREMEYLNSMHNRQNELYERTLEAESSVKAIKIELENSKLQSEIINEQAKEIMDSIEAELDEAEEKYREIYGRQGGGPMSAVPKSGSVVDYARSRIGSPYVWGGSGPSVFDCSGLVMWAYAQVGISLPHQTEAMYAVADEIVPLSEARPGDVLYRSGHVGLCTGYGASSYVHAPTFGAYVREGDSVSWSGFTCALRFY